MHQTPYIALTIFSIIVLAIDLYTFYGIRKLITKFNNTILKIISIIYWIIPLIIIGSLFFLFSNRDSADPKTAMIYFHYFSGTFLLLYVPKLVFILFNFLDDLLHTAKWLIQKFRKRKNENLSGKKITRNQFLTRVGIAIAGLPFISIIYGIGWGRFNFIVRKSNLHFPNIPKEFNEFKIAQFSDFHLGSFDNRVDKIEEVVSLINKQNPDVIVFTGDLVNNTAEEVEPFIPALSKLKAKYGKFSILGNHDYGDYVHWSSLVKKKENLQKLLQQQNEMGFKLLLNSNVKINIGDGAIDLIGVENWGLPPFPQYGNLQKALENIDDSSFKILLTHDPTHWDAEVVGKTDIDLTLSGHTHGAQFGVEIPGRRWSPVNLRYKHWGGIYKKGKQVLNVNTGVGFIGFPGRIGMPPEISLITLKKISK